MDKFKRNERLAVMTQVLTAAPNKIFTLSHFCEMFGAAKSTVSEDTAILAATMRQFGLGTVETVTGAAGGMRYRPMAQEGEGRRFMEEICEMMRAPSRVLVDAVKAGGSQLHWMEPLVLTDGNGKYTAEWNRIYRIEDGE